MGNSECSRIKTAAAGRRRSAASAALQAARGLPLQASFDVFRDSEAGRKLRSGLALAGAKV